jgi:hypothetical protein
MMKRMTINFALLVVLVSSSMVGLFGCSKGLVHSDQANFKDKMVYSLPKGYIKVINDKDGVRVETTYEPDENQYYLLAYTSNIGFDDDITIQTNEKGFLSSIQSTTTSRVPEIIKKLQEISIEALKIPLKVTNVPSFELIFDPKEINEYSPQKFSETMNLIDTMKNPPGVNAEQKKSAKDAAQKTLSTMTGNLYRDFNIAYISLEHPKASFLYTDLQRSASERPSADNRGICYRAPLPFKLRLLVGDLCIERIVYLPNYSKLVTFDVNRPAFVQKIQSLTFTNGLLTEVHMKKDSELLAALGIPADLVKTVAGLPLQLIQFKSGNLEAQNTLLQTQINQIQLERQLQELRSGQAIQ